MSGGPSSRADGSAATPDGGPTEGQPSAARPGRGRGRPDPGPHNTPTQTLPTAARAGRGSHDTPTQARPSAAQPDPGPHRPSGLSPEQLQRWTRIGALAACALLLGYAETFVPIPIPGVKLGLANIAVLVALADGDTTGAACVALIKVLATGLLFGSPISMAYSAVGTALALAAMIPLSKLRTMKLWMTSIVGALLHEVGQLMVAQLILHTTAVWYLLPPMMVAGCVTGALCGVWATSLDKAIPQADEFPVPSNTDTRLQPHAPSARTMTLAIVTAVFTIVVLHAAEAPVLVACLVLALAACLATRVPLRSLVRMLPLLIGAGVLTLSLNLIATQGAVDAGVAGLRLGPLGPLGPAHDALAQSGLAVARLAALLLASRAFAGLIERQNLVGGVAWVVRPLARCGLQTDGFVVAFDVAVRLIPQLALTFQGERKGHLKLRDLRDRIPSLIRDACLQATQL